MPINENQQELYQAVERACQNVAENATQVLSGVNLFPVGGAQVWYQPAGLSRATLAPDYSLKVDSAGLYTVVDYADDEIAKRKTAHMSKQNGIFKPL